MYPMWSLLPVTGRVHLRCGDGIVTCMACQLPFDNIFCTFSPRPLWKQEYISLLLPNFILGEIPSLRNKPWQIHGLCITYHSWVLIVSQSQQEVVIKWEINWLYRIPSTSRTSASRRGGRDGRPRWDVRVGGITSSWMGAEGEGRQRLTCMFERIMMRP